MGPQTGTGEAATADFATFFDRLRGSLVRLAWTLTGDTETASDIVQTAFTDAYRDWARISTVENPDTWVRRMVINRCSNAQQDPCPRPTTNHQSKQRRPHLTFRSAR